VIILAFDACFGGCSVAVWQDGQLLASDAVGPGSGPGQADLLVQLVAASLRQAGLAVDQVDRIAVTCGPGGFTGVRVGVAAARALALATGKPVVATTSLHVMAAEALDAARDHFELVAERDLIVAVDAHRGELYVQSFDPAGVPRTAAHAVGVDDAGWLAMDRPHVIVGSGAVLLASAAEKRGCDVRVGLPTLLPSAQYLATLAAALPPLVVLSPLYLRAPDAKPSTVALPSRA
jgi:tRNA threonylcarbamoyladenosine biosynthesis protein TsaB